MKAKKAGWQDLNMAEEEPRENTDGLVFIAYAEREDDVAFEITEDLEEALGIVEQMRDDGFVPKLYQAHEIEVPGRA